MNNKGHRTVELLPLPRPPGRRVMPLIIAISPVSHQCRTLDTVLYIDRYEMRNESD